MKLEPSRWLWLIVATAVVLRIGAALYLGNDVREMPGIADQLSYHTLATRVLDGHGFSFATGWWPATPAGEPTAHWSYLYVLFLAATYGLAGPVPLVWRVIQAVVVGVLQPLLTYSIARRLFGPRVGLLSAALAGGYAYFVYYAGALMTESLCFVALLWSIDVALRIGLTQEREAIAGRGTWLQLGLALASTVLLRQAMLLVVPIILGWAAWQSGHRARGAQGLSGAGRQLGGLALAATVLTAAILPWTLRNYIAFHEVVLLNTNAGFAFFWGNHPIHGTRFTPILPSERYGALIPDELRGLNEAQLDKALLRQGLGFVIEDPLRYGQLSLSRAEEYLRVWPWAESGIVANTARLVSFGLCGPLFIIGILLSARLRPPDAADALAGGASGVWLLLAVAGTHSLIHLLTWTLVRYRLPVDALFMPFAALAVVRAWDHVSHRRVHALAAGGRSDQLRAAPPPVPPQ